MRSSRRSRLSRRSSISIVVSTADPSKNHASGAGPNLSIVPRGNTDAATRADPKQNLLWPDTVAVVDTLRRRRGKASKAQREYLCCTHWPGRLGSEREKHCDSRSDPRLEARQELGGCLDAHVVLSADTK